MLNTLVQGSGPPLIWGHGLQASIAFEQSSGLFHSSPSRLRRIRFDAPGHGQSDAAMDASACQWSSLGRTMLEVARLHVPEGRFALGGQSMGCAAALHAAVMAPERVSHLVLATPPTAWAGRPAQARKHQRALGLLQRRGIEPFMAANRQFPAFPEWLRAARPHLEHARLEALAGFDAQRLSPLLLGAAGSDLPDPERLRELQMPALILAWSDDETHPLLTAEQLAELLPAATLLIASDALAVERWPELIDDFVTGPSPASPSEPSVPGPGAARAD
jgi:3-oxoadipate enol-lactonase